MKERTSYGRLSATRNVKRLWVRKKKKLSESTEGLGAVQGKSGGGENAKEGSRNRKLDDRFLVAVLNVHSSLAKHRSSQLTDCICMTPLRCH